MGPSQAASSRWARRTKAPLFGTCRGNRAASTSRRSWGKSTNVFEGERRNARSFANPASGCDGPGPVTAASASTVAVAGDGGGGAGAGADGAGAGTAGCGGTSSSGGAPASCGAGGGAGSGGGGAGAGGGADRRPPGLAPA